MSFSNEEIKEFVTEAEELLDQAEAGLLAVDRGAPFPTHYDAVFRAFHSIKGAAGLMEMTEIQAHVHQLENILTELKGRPELDKSHVDLFLRGVDATRKLLNGENIEFDYGISSKGAPVSSPAKSSNVPLKAPLPESIGKIIVVDDEPEIVTMLSEILAEGRLEVIGTTNPTEVYALVEREKPDAVITDIKMPGLTGTRLLAELATRFPDLPVLFLSGQITTEDLMLAIDSGVFAVIEKPFDINIVLAGCTNAVRRHQLTRLLNHSIDLLLYQLPDLEQYLRSRGKEDICNVLHQEMETLLERRRELRRQTRKKAA